MRTGLIRAVLRLGLLLFSLFQLGYPLLEPSKFRFCRFLFAATADSVALLGPSVCGDSRATPMLSSPGLTGRPSIRERS